MFNLEQLQLLHSVLNKDGLGFPARIAKVVASTNDILEANIKELANREERQNAASKLRSVGGTDDKGAA